MPKLQRVRKPKTSQGKRFLESRLPKLIEDQKNTMCIRGINANNTVLQILKDVGTLKKPNATFYNRKNDLKPFENPSSLEFFSLKTDAPLFLFGSHNKKRPNNLVIGRMYDNHILDMFEFGVESFKALSDFKNAKFAVGSKPLLIFTGDVFENDLVYQRMKNLLIDFFHGPSVENINLKGIDHVILFSEESGKISFRNYRLISKSSKPSEFDVEEIGPCMNWVARRNNIASADHFKQACKKPPQLKSKVIKNVKEDPFGTKHGRIHMQRQDYKQLQLRKVRGLKSDSVKNQKKRKVTNKGQEMEPPHKKHQ